MLSFNACSGNGRDIGANCTKDSECNSRMCVGLHCVDPWGDFDGDGISNEEERVLHTNPASPDTDGDGRPDGQELQDSDGDGIIDALESAVKDQDHDCLPDQFDPHNNKPDATSAQLAKWMCNHKGVCGMGAGYIRASCIDRGTDKATLVCDFSKVPNYEKKEKLCDNLDNDCNGVTDEGFSLGNVPVGGVCQAPGICGQGVVECNKAGNGTRCSTGPKGSQYSGRPETCDHLDDNCNGLVDENMTYKGLALGQPCSGDGECGVGVVECGKKGVAICSTNPGGRQYQGKVEQCDGLDDDCNGVTDDVTDFRAMAETCPLMGVCADHPDQVTARCVDSRIVCDYSGVDGYAGKNEKACDGLDDDCDGHTDEDFVYMEFGRQLHVGDSCGLGACQGGIVECAKDRVHAQCSGNIKAGKELCNNIDDDCDGWVDEGISKNIGNKFKVVWWGMPGPRLDAATASLADRIVVYGGIRSKDNPTPLFDMYVVDPGHRNSYRIVSPDLPQLTRPAAVAVNDRVLVFGNNPAGQPEVFSLPDTLDKVMGPTLIDSKIKCVDLSVTRGPGDTAILYCPDLSKKGRVFVVKPLSLTVSDRFTMGFVTGGCVGFDQSRGELFIVGGRDADGRILNQSTGLNLKTGLITSTDLSARMPRIADAACVDLGDGRIIVQGGVTPGSVSKDTYIVALRGDTKLLSVLGGPPALSSHFAAAWAGRAVVFDGETRQDSVISAWVLDMDAPSWYAMSVQPDVTGGTDLVTVVDQDAGVLYVFAPDHDRLSTTTWFTSLIRDNSLVMSRHSVSGILPSTGANASWDGSGHGIRFFGGNDSQVYRLDLMDWTFRTIEAQGTHPPIRKHPLVAWSKALKGLLIFGGKAGGTQLSDCWLFKDGIWLSLNRQSPVMVPQKSIWDEAGHRVVTFTKDGRVMLFDALTGLWQQAGKVSDPNNSDPINIEYAGWDPDSRIALLLRQGLENAVVMHISVAGALNIHYMKMTKPATILSRASVFFDPFRRRFGFLGGLDARGVPSAAFLTLDEVCAP